MYFKRFCVGMIGVLFCWSIARTSDKAAMTPGSVGTTNIVQALAAGYTYEKFFDYLKKTPWWQKLTPYEKPTVLYTVFAITDAAFTNFNKMNLLEIRGDLTQTQQNYNDFIGYLIAEGDHPLATMVGRDDLLPTTVSGRLISPNEIKKAVFEVVVHGFGRVIVCSKMVINPALTDRYAAFVEQK